METETENKPSEGQAKKKKEQGALWLRKSKNGNSFLSGAVKTLDGEEIKVVVFKNSYKQEGSNQPDYRIYLDESQMSSDMPAAEAAKPSTKADKQDVVEEDIPF
jgi:uncharacterized protein (DUF736 family)